MTYQNKVIEHISDLQFNERNTEFGSNVDKCRKRREMIKQYPNYYAHEK